MPDENTAPTPLAGMGDPIHPPGQEPSTPPTDPQAGEGHKPPRSAEDYERMIADLRKENAGHRTKLNKFEADEKTRQTAQMTEQQKLQQQYDDLKAQSDEVAQATLERTIHYEVRLQAAALGVNPKHLEKVARFVGWEDIEVDEYGAPTNVKDVLEKLIKDMPELLGRQAGPPPTSGGPTNPSRSQTSGAQEITDAYIATLTPVMYSGLSPEMKAKVGEYMQNRVNSRRR